MRDLLPKRFTSFLPPANTRSLERRTRQVSVSFDDESIRVQDI